MPISSLDKITYQGHMDALPLGQGNCHKYLKTFLTADDVLINEIRHETEKEDFAFNKFRRMLFGLKVEITLTQKKKKSHAFFLECLISSRCF